MKTTLISILIIISLSVQGQESKRTLFLGNSYTAVNNLPQLIANIATSVGDTLVFDSNTPGSYTLEAHSTNTTSIDKIKYGNWDFVVLQEQSQRPSFPISQVMVEVFPFASYLDSLINVNNPCGETIFYMTWGRKNGDADNCASWPPVCTYEGMDSLLHLRYMMMADSNNAVVSPVGNVWRHIRQNYPSIELYQLDESHPSAAGSYATACSFYTSIFRKDPSLITYDYSLSATDAANIRTATKLVVFDSLLHWHIGEYDLASDFTYTPVNGYTFQFTNLSQNASRQIWDFGDGDTSMTANPTHIYTANGTYIVTLIASDDCDSDTSTTIINVTMLSIADNPKLSGVEIYPNPSSGLITINLHNNKINKLEIFDIVGKIQYSKTKLSNITKLDLNKLNNGIYFIKLVGNDETLVYEIVLY